MISAQSYQLLLQALCIIVESEGPNCRGIFEFRTHFEIDITAFVSLKRKPRDSFSQAFDMASACQNKLKLPSFSGVVCTGTDIWDLEIVESYKDFCGKFIREQALLSGEIVIHSGHDFKIP